MTTRHITTPLIHLNPDTPSNDKPTVNILNLDVFLKIGDHFKDWIKPTFRTYLVFSQLN